MPETIESTEMDALQTETLAMANAKLMKQVEELQAQLAEVGGIASQFYGASKSAREVLKGLRVCLRDARFPCEQLGKAINAYEATRQPKDSI